MRTLTKYALILLAVASIGLAAFLLVGHKDKETWATLTSLLAVVAAVVAVLPALRVLEIQEDALRPRPIPHFDLSSRYNLLQLRVKNFGGGVAYDVHIEWREHPLNQKGEEITSVDQIPVLLPQDSVSTLVGSSQSMVKEISETRFEGECRFRDSSGKWYSDHFVCSVAGSLKQLVHDDEMLRTLRDLQEIPTELERIAVLLERIGQQRGNPDLTT